MLELNNELEFISAQPENRTVLEEALEFAWHQLIKNALSPYPDLRDPLSTKEEFLACLAAERGVLDWQHGDTLAQRRITTISAFKIHSKAGTRSGLRDAIKAIGFSARVQREDLPYSLVVSAELEEAPLSIKVQSRLSARATAYKSERDTLDLRLVRGSELHTYLGAHVETGVILDCQPYIATETLSDSEVSHGILAEIYIILDCEAAWKQA